ncbi:MAG TPA: GNAT family N-acetyltransferase [Pyrinomonadaceae bacterium]|jgi:predicted GNAT superfamily acetyltransferase|nr:GNAT family N-acetyltransferase [Pyrinomonadaceae bacterium]
MSETVIRECVTIAELDNCVRLQREVFGLPDLEISPRRHLIVSRQAGGWTLGAFVDERLVGFVHHLAAVRGAEVFGYSHMMAVDPTVQNQGIGARLKWSQRERAIQEGRSFIKWTWDPLQARNAHFNLNRLGVTVSSYAENFYGTDYPTSPVLSDVAGAGIDSDRLFAEWRLESPRVNSLAQGSAGPGISPGGPAATIEVPIDWNRLCRENAGQAKQQQLRVRAEFQQAFAVGLVAAGFERSSDHPRYLLYAKEDLQSAENR